MCVVCGRGEMKAPHSLQDGEGWLSHSWQGVNSRGAPLLGVMAAGVRGIVGEWLGERGFGVLCLTVLGG